MPESIQFTHTSGEDLYANVRDSSSDIWNESSFETYDSDNYTNYDIALTEQGISGVYVGSFPSVDAGLYSVVVYERPGPSPKEGDDSLGAYSVLWDGTALSTGNATLANQTTILADIAALPTAEENRIELLEHAIDGIVDVQTALVRILAYAQGKVVITGDDTTKTVTFFKENDSSEAFVLTVPTDSTGRTNDGS